MSSPKNPRIPLMKNPEHFPNPGDVLDGRAALVKYAEVQLEMGKSCRPRMCARYDVSKLVQAIEGIFQRRLVQSCHQRPYLFCWEVRGEIALGFQTVML